MNSHASSSVDNLVVIRARKQVCGSLTCRDRGRAASHFEKMCNHVDLRVVSARSFGAHITCAPSQRPRRRSLVLSLPFSHRENGLLFSACPGPHRCRCVRSGTCRAICNATSTWQLAWLICAFVLLSRRRACRPRSLSSFTKLSLNERLPITMWRSITGTQKPQQGVFVALP